VPLAPPVKGLQVSELLFCDLAHLQANFVGLPLRKTNFIVKFVGYTMCNCIVPNIPNIPRTATWTIFYIDSSVIRNEVVQQLI